MGNNNSMNNDAKDQTPQDAPVTTVSEPKVEPKAEPKTEPKNEPATPKYGIVTNCLSLAVRSEPNTDGMIVGTLGVLSKVEILRNDSNNDFYLVISENSLSGYCMKKYITLK